MEYYDVIIIGAGIAGCGLAYNLKRIGYKGNVLIIDKEEAGANSCYGHRTIFPEVAKEYKLKTTQQYNGIKLGVYNKIVTTLNCQLLGINYNKTCAHLLKKSQYTYKKEDAQKITINTLITNKQKYSFQYLIDCSGHSFFLKKLLKQPKPFKYWIARTRLLKNNTPLNKKYIHYFYGDNEYLEDAYVIGDQIAIGDWTYANSPNKNIPSPKNSFFKTHCSKKTLK